VGLKTLAVFDLTPDGTAALRHTQLHLVSQELFETDFVLVQEGDAVVVRGRDFQELLEGLGFVFDFLVEHLHHEAYAVVEFVFEVLVFPVGHHLHPRVAQVGVLHFVVQQHGRLNVLRVHHLFGQRKLLLGSLGRRVQVDNHVLAVVSQHADRPVLTLNH